MKYRKINNQTGLTVIELMIGLMLSLLLVGGVIQVYLGTKSTYSVTEGMSRLQENTRFSMDMMASDIRMAGYIPCSRPETTTNTVVPTSWWTAFFDNPIKGFEDGANPFPDDSSNEVAVGTDSILILRGGDKVAGVNLLDASNNEIILQRNLETEDEWVEDGSLMIACDATHASLFQADDIQSSVATTVEIASGSGDVPGNTSTDLGHAFGNDAQISNYKAVVYYVSDAVSGDGYSLYRRYLNTNGSKQNTVIKEELIEGIESMQILYGLDTDSTADGVADRYVKADAINDDEWGSVVSVRVGILYASEDGLRDEEGTDNKTYIVANTSIGVTSDQDETHAQDRRKRYVSNMTVNIRNI